MPEKLEELIRICREGEADYGEGAEHVKDPALKALLHAVSVDRARFAGELEQFAARWRGSSTQHPAKTAGEFHRNGKHLRFDLANDDAVLAGIEASDEHARQCYDEAIKDTETPEELVGILRNQAQAIVGMLDRIRALRERRKAA
jgi:uncharacterized protein (TIGR02284 family)